MVDGLIEGLRKAGRNVIDIGLAPTPVVYFARLPPAHRLLRAVTGSHNPPDYNGFKIVVGGETLSGDAITDLYARIAEDRLHHADDPGSWQQRDIDDDYIAAHRRRRADRPHAQGRGRRRQRRRRRDRARSVLAAIGAEVDAAVLRSRRHLPATTIRTRASRTTSTT